MSATRSLIGLVGAAVLATASIAAAPSAATNDVTVDGDTVTVSGTLAEGLAPVVIGTDPADDAVGSGLGVDVSEYAVSFPDDATVALHVTLGDANPATGYLPQGFSLEIAPVIDDELTELTASATLDGGLEFGAQECTVNPDTGVNECSTTPVDGTYEAGVLTWLLPSTATPGAMINGQYVHSNLAVSTATTGGVTLVNGFLDEMGISAVAATPSSTLLIDGAPAATADLSDTGYAVSASGLSAGDHTVSVELCGATADFQGNPTECSTIDLGTVTVG